VAYPEPLENLVAAFERFPGIGRRSAERLAFHVLRDPAARELARAIDRAIDGTLRCGVCSNVSETDPCSICSDPARDATIVCVVEEPRHVEAIERSGAYRGRYHVLMGAFNTGRRDRARAPDDRKAGPARPRGRLSRGDPRTDPDAEGERPRASCSTRSKPPRTARS
jgi:recombination protein RecR